MRLDAFKRAANWTAQAIPKIQTEIQNCRDRTQRGEAATGEKRMGKPDPIPLPNIPLPDWRMLPGVPGGRQGGCLARE